MEKPEDPGKSEEPERPGEQEILNEQSEIKPEVLEELVAEPEELESQLEEPIANDEKETKSIWNYLISALISLPIVLITLFSYLWGLGMLFG